MRRRDFMRAAGGATAVTAATASAAQPAVSAEEEDGEDGGDGQQAPDWPSFLDDANGLDTGEDMRGEDEVTVEVGAGDGLEFDPAGIWIDPGTTVVWEWTGDGGGHNVAVEEGEADFSSDIVSEEGHTFEHDFAEDQAGITTYKCEPHEGQGMKGGVAVGDDIPTVSAGEAAMKEPKEFGTDIHEHWVGVTVTLMVSVSLVFTFFTLKYGESPHTSGGN